MRVPNDIPLEPRENRGNEALPLSIKLEIPASGRYSMDAGLMDG
jgi:hypothetical protein